MSLSFLHFADAMFHIYPIIALCSFFRLEISREYQQISFSGLQNNRLRLCSGNLLRQYELSACKVNVRLIQEENDLYGKIHVAIQILMQGIESTFPILQDQDGCFLLPTLVALPKHL